MLKKWLFVFILIFAITSCPAYNNVMSNHRDMSFAEAEKAGYVAIGPDGIANVDRLDLFHDRIQKHKKSQLTIVSFTDEGDPIFLDLKFDGQDIHYERDNTWDKFGGNNKGIEATTCSSFNKRPSNEISNRTEYVLSDCSADIGFSFPDREEYLLFFLDEITETEAEDAVIKYVNKPITIISVTKKENQYEVKWELEGTCESGIDYIDIYTGKSTNAVRTMC